MKGRISNAMSAIAAYGTLFAITLGPFVLYAVFSDTDWEAEWKNAAIAILIGVTAMLVSTVMQQGRTIADLSDRIDRIQRALYYHDIKVSEF